MPAAPLPANEAERLTDLRRYQVLDTQPEAGLDALTALAAELAGTPIALISLTDASRQWFKARVGLDVVEIPRDWAPCAHTVATGQSIVCPDMRADPRFADNPLVQGPPHLRFYAGMALITPRRTVLGTLAVIDTQPRTLTHFQQKALTVLAQQVVDQLELRMAYRDLAALRAQEQAFEARLLQEKTMEAQRLAAELHDGVGQDLTGISMLVAAIMRHADTRQSPLTGPLAEINRLLNEAIETCRNTAQDQGGFIVRKEGLAGALQRFVRRLDVGDGPRIELEQSPIPANCIDETATYHLFRIAQEAISNARKHSGASVIKVRSYYSDGAIVIDVEDNGVGIRQSTHTTGTTGGSGTSIMEYRARTIGALLTFSEPPDGGLRVSCRLKCR